MIAASNSNQMRASGVGLARDCVRAGFTLLELLVVLAIMVVLAAFIAPRLANSFQHRELDQEAVRLLALTEYARGEAQSQGIPTQVWIDPQSGNYGAEAVPGYDGDKGVGQTATGQGTQGQGQSGQTMATGVEAKQYTLPSGTKFDSIPQGTRTKEGYTQMIQFDPDGAPTPMTGVDHVSIIDQANESESLTLTQDGWGYQITEGGANGAH